MRILITNDDGIEAPGLDVLQKIASDLSKDVWVVAPETDQSGAAHSLTLHEPLRLRKLSERVFAVKGTPTDCVIMGVRYILQDELPTLVLSGVNRGANSSPTTSPIPAPSRARSKAPCSASRPSRSASPSIGRIRRRSAGKRRWSLARISSAKLMKAGWPRDVLINVNFPDREPSKARGYSGYRARQARSGLLAHRRPHGYAGQPLLLARVQIAIAASRQGDGPLGGEIGRDIGDASLSELNAWRYVPEADLASGDLECVRKSAKRFSDKTHDKTKSWSALLSPSKADLL